MKTNPIKTILATTALAFLGAAPLSSLAQVVKIDGSSTVFPITEGIAEDFQKANKGYKVTVGVSGTGGGFKKFCRDETDISDASRPITAKEMEACKAAGVEYFELPVAFDALTVVINPKNTWLKEATVAELKAIWEPASQGKVLRWNQVNPKWPDQPMKLFGAGSDSGTFEYFTEAIVGKAKSSRGDFTASEDDNVLVQGVAGDVNAMGYFGYAYYAENTSKLKALPVIAAPGKPAVAPSAKAVEDGSYQPLARPIFIYVKAKSLEKPEVKKFVDFYMENGAKMANEVKYVGLPAGIYKANLKHMAEGKKGTVFGGKNEVGVSIEELVKREAKN
ncbi:PstS family phosphate ABC transporter substrate-binding protein [Rhodoferax sp.]|uniref:PstS family phosphate ABC transporter substrate-binding protein n=1 Tax=Rhodoferax sp. TaxID=50421 RepID=UPI0026173BF7|nr:PstS family phosphate ABC transporter substrate-binding protein [Rhodoferax sp.]MDD2808697.1 PstS family phosphate ABC transporter substrate-binding protein [Rhodoferax sp.]MDD4943620.1 PstS family phosphate ABC transporter substrate-binding protein [Rhodoferax sp.]MDD5479188.1 PstS family phosphate ABC transporter substrate-binding protein [Rhodoferax sp.]